MVELEQGWTGCSVSKVELREPLAGGTTTVQALAYTELVGTPCVGDRLLLNVSALARGLGTGGYALVVAMPDRLPPEPDPGPGHLVKARYTPLQTMVLGADEQESTHHAVLAQADNLTGMPVVVADLHSTLPAIIAGARASVTDANALRIAYIMTDGGALPAQFSRNLATLRANNWLIGTVTVGQSFGGDLEAVSTHSGLLAARHIWKADIAIVIQGPGNLGTGTAWGFSGVSTGEAINAVNALGGCAIGCLRISGADARERHQGVSHHSLTAYGRVALSPADIVEPSCPTGTVEVAAFPSELQTRISTQLDTLFDTAPHLRRCPVSADGMLAALGTSPVRLSTMGRGLDADPSGFIAAAVAGKHAVTLLPA